MKKETLKEVDSQLVGLPPLLSCMRLTLKNKCECEVCKIIRTELMKMAKQHEANIVLSEAS